MNLNKKIGVEVESDLKNRKYEIKIVGNVRFKNFEISNCINILLIKIKN